MLKNLCIIERNTSEGSRTPEKVSSPGPNLVLQRWNQNLFSKFKLLNKIVPMMREAPRYLGLNNKWYPNHLNFPCLIDNHKHELSSCAEFFAMISKTGEVIPGSELTNIPEVSEHSFTLCKLSRLDWRLWSADRGAKVPSLWNRAGRRHESGPMIGRRRWVECVIHPRQDKGIRKIKSETSSLGYLWHTSQLKEGIQKLKNQWWSTCWCRFFLYCS